MIDIALKEWAVVCDLLLEGRLALLLRKGGIHESGGPGVFRLEHDRFLLFPSWAHQKPDMLKPPYRERVEIKDEPAEITFHGYCAASRIWQVPGRAAFDRLDDLHCWSKPHIDMRFHYKPDRPLYLLAVRAYRLTTPRTVPYHSAFAGCVSWVPLDAKQAADETGATPTMSDEAFKEVLHRVEAAFQP